MHAHHPLLPLLLRFLVLAGVALEIFWYLGIRKRVYPWREMFASIGIAVMRVPARTLSVLVVAPVAYFVWAHRLATIPLNTWWGLTLLFLGEELAYYWSHRAGHEIRWLWASHVVHHTPEHLHLASAFRLGVTELFSGGWLFHVPLYLMGFHPLAVAAMLGLNLSYQFWLHTDLVGRLGPLEWVLNTPSHHRVHHASNAEYLDRNFGGIAIIWDRLFGTFVGERPNTTIRYGLVHPLGTLNPFHVAFHEWRAMARDVARARTWRERWTQLFGRPGSGLSDRTRIVPRNKVWSHTISLRGGRLEQRSPV